MSNQKFQSSLDSYKMTIDVIDENINDRELSTYLFVESSKYYFGDSMKTLKLVEHTYFAYLGALDQGWKRDAAKKVVVPIAMRCFVKQDEEKSNLMWFWVYTIIAVCFAAWLSTKVGIEW